VKGRDALREMLRAGRPAEQPSLEQGSKRVSSGAVRAMNLGLQRLSKDAEDARTLRAQLEQGERIIDLEPSLVDASFVADRIAGAADPDFESLKTGIAEHGQQVPILVRPHPQDSGRYQAAYGHRRLRAAAELKRPVRALVRPLSDAELVIAQGKENNERRDLSFIERALFAAHLEERKFDRPTIQAALGVDKPEVSRLISVATAVSSDLIVAIGPAPKVGRPRWLALAEKLGRSSAASKVEAALRSEAFEKADSDHRFNIVLAALQAHSTSGIDTDVLTASDGRTVARLERSSKTLRLAVADASFREFLEARLPELLKEFEVSGGKGADQ
jgi:ParB family transcriptional regulator, chromosome partitioning protein